MDKTSKLIAAFKKVKELGFVKSNRMHDTGVGKTFEDYMHVIENNIPEADLYGFEIKTKRSSSASYLTLFTKSPSYPTRVNTYLRNEYGTPDEIFPDVNVLHTSIFSTYQNTYLNKYGFQLINNESDEKIYIQISDLKTTKILEDNIYYTYKNIEQSIDKLKNLMYVHADSKKGEDGEYFYFKEAELFYEPSLHCFLNMLSQGEVMVDIRLGTYKRGINAGKPHDHGTAFRIKPNLLPALYDVQVKVD